MGRKRKQRRQAHGSAWHWKQTDYWYYTMPGTRKRVPLFDEKGERIRGRENKEAATLSMRPFLGYTAAPDFSPAGETAPPARESSGDCFQIPIPAGFGA